MARQWTTQKCATNAWAVMADGKRVAVVAQFKPGFTVFGGPKPSEAKTLVTKASKAKADEVISAFVDNA